MIELSHSATTTKKRILTYFNSINYIHNPTLTIEAETNHTNMQFICFCQSHTKKTHKQKYIFLLVCVSQWQLVQPVYVQYLNVHPFLFHDDNFLKKTKGKTDERIKSLSPVVKENVSVCFSSPLYLRSSCPWFFCNTFQNLTFFTCAPEIRGSMVPWCDNAT